jgi:structural maintenance of chromosome 4
VKKADVDVATSERDALAQKAEGLRTQHQEAQQALETLKAEQQAKVR